MNHTVCGAAAAPFWNKLLRWTGIGVLALLFCAVLFLLGLRGAAARRHRLSGPNALEEGIFVPLGGQEQYLLIRSENTENPVLLWLHGGPAGADGFANYVFQTELAKHYTVVNWDQRGCGRTYYRNRAADPNNETATFRQAQADLQELVDYLLARFGQEKLVLVGHSYGSMLGSSFALAHPEKVAAYVGVGQFVNLESDVYSYEDALAEAKARGDDTAAMEQAYRSFCADRTILNMLKLRGYTGRYHVPARSANTLLLGIASPHMGWDDIRWFLRQIGNTEQYLALNAQLFDCLLDADVRAFGTEFSVPVGFLSGSDDWTTPVAYTEMYCEEISAPRKQLRLLAGCGHAPQYDAPQEFAAQLLEMLTQLQS